MPDATDTDIDAAVAQCGGDLRLTIAALLADNKAMQKELDFAGLAMSYGFSRGWFARRRTIATMREDDHHEPLPGTALAT